MHFNFLTHIQTCYEMIRDYVPVSMIYYSHIPAAIASLFIGTLVLSKNKRLPGILVFLVTLVFAIWSCIDIILWVSTNSQMYMFFWSLMVILEATLFVLNIYLISVFSSDKDVSFLSKFIWLILLLPIIVLAGTTFNLTHFDIPSCMPINGSLYQNYALPLYGLLLIWFIFVVIKNLKVEKTKRKQILLISSGSFLFLFLFFVANYLTDYLISNNILSVIDSYKIEMYSLFAMPIFLALLAFVIVKFKAFDIKLLATQALVWALLILIGSEFFFIESTVNMVLTAITLLISGGLGLAIVRSVKKEVALREELERANTNQESLIHFISHQLKGFFTKSKMIFAGIIEDDFEKSSDVLKDVAKEGLLSDNNAVSMIQDILGASNYKKGTIAYNMKETDLAEIVRGVCSGFIKEIKEKGLELKLNISNKPVIVLADVIQITQVIKNLVDNSIKYTPSGSLTVSLNNKNMEGKDKVVFEIEDTGVGLSESDKNKLFTEGGKGEESMKMNVNSTGYGLYIVKKIVENHGGKIWAESDGRGRGARFFVTLPIR